MRLLLIYISLFIATTASAQLKYDANWVFGENVWIDFEHDTVKTIDVCGFEAAASISHPETGELLLYYSENGAFCNGASLGSIRDASGQLISNGDSIISYGSSTNGVIFLPKTQGSDSIFYLVHHGCNLTDDTCYTNPFLFAGLKYTYIVKNSFGEYEVTAKNINIGVGLNEEKIAPTFSSDNSDRIVYSPKLDYDVTSNLPNIFYKILIDNNGIVRIDSQAVGPNLPNFDLYGEIEISSNGEIMCIARQENGLVDIFSINRCNGDLSFVERINNLPIAYGVAISSNNRFLYTSSSSGAFRVHQFDLEAPDIIASKVQIYSDNIELTSGQLELAPDNRIYVGRLNDTILDFIPFPNLKAPACGYNETGLALNVGSKSLYGLPHMPNYNMPPSGVFAAQAGTGDTLCNNGTGVTLGVAQQPNILYQWQANATLSSTTKAQPVATPTQDTWYYLTVTDTTSVSCAVNVDSVFVKVEHCVGVEEPEQLDIRVYPNPTSRSVSVILSGSRYVSGERWAMANSRFELYNLTGQQLMSQPITQSNMQLSLDLPEGIYIYKILVNNELKTTDKLVIVE